MLDLQSTDYLQEVMHSLGKNKKKANDTWVILQTAIDLHVTTPASVTNKLTKPQLCMHVIDKFCSYAWAATGNEISDGITLFNITFVTEPAARAMAAKVEWLRAVESSRMAMTYSDASNLWVRGAYRVWTKICLQHQAASGSLWENL